MIMGRTRGQVIDINRSPKIEIPRLRKRQHSAPGSLYIPALAKRGYEMAMTALPIQPIPVCVALLKGRLRDGCCTECCTVCWPAVVSAISLTFVQQSTSNYIIIMST